MAILDWKREIDIKAILRRIDEKFEKDSYGISSDFLQAQAKNIILAIVGALKDKHRDLIVDNEKFSWCQYECQFVNVDKFNRWIGVLYDWADENRIWLTPA